MASAAGRSPGCARHDELLREERRVRVERLAVVRVLDDRGVTADALAAEAGASLRAMRDEVETARALESLPAVAAAAHDGSLSAEQLAPVVHLADESTDADWAARAPGISPIDLSRQVRTRTKPTVEESRARQQARHLRLWWSPDHGMLHVRGALPDLMGAEFEATISRMVEQLRPPAGGMWDTFEHRAADSLLALCRRSGACDDAGDPAGDGVDRAARSVEGAPTVGAKPVLVVEVPRVGPATIVGIPLPDAMVEQLLANATVEPVLVDDDGVPLALGRRRSVLSPKVARGVLLRDGHCRWPGCERRQGLEIHHLVPRSRGGRTTSPIWRWSARLTTASWSPTGDGPSLATRTAPTACVWSGTRTCGTRMRNGSGCHRGAQAPASPDDERGIGTEPGQASGHVGARACICASSAHRLQIEGATGRCSMRVAEILDSKGRDVVVTLPETTVTRVAERLRLAGVGAVVVTTDGRHVDGLVSEGDIVHAVARHGDAALTMRASDIMQRGVRTCASTDRVRDVMVMMTNLRVRHVPVVDRGTLRGIVSIGDLVKRVVEDADLELHVLRDAYLGHR
jgi:CBS domain-containing protein